MAGWLHGGFVGDWLFVFPLCGFSLSLFCNSHAPVYLGSCILKKHFAFAMCRVVKVYRDGVWFGVVGTGPLLAAVFCFHCHQDSSFCWFLSGAGWSTFPCPVCPPRNPHTFHTNISYRTSITSGYHAWRTQSTVTAC